MSPSFVKRWFGQRSAPHRRQGPRFIRPCIEGLEDRILLAATLAANPLLQAATPLAASQQSSSPLNIVSAAPSSNGFPPEIVVGRTLSSYFSGDVQNNQLTITYTVYNEQATAETGVLLTDTLQPGVTVQSASQQPDQSGQKLAWSLGTINGFDRTNVSLTVNLPGTIPLQIDTGAAAFAMLNAGAVSNSTPAATLRQGTLSDPTLLASTPDANTTDPFIQEEAAKLNYDPQQIFNFLHNDVGYNSYTGSLRGARGTLWSSAGNALDVASLGVALMRASGAPAQYVQGALSQSQAQQLILSMFPASYQTVGYVPAGTQTADPANDPQLLSETESHYWFQFDSGSGFQDADPLIGGARIGQTFTTPTGMFTQVADNLRAKTEVKLTAEIYSQAAALFGLGGGQSQTQTVVLDQTFNDVDLVGRPITIGNFVSQSSTGFILTATTTTYTPYVQLGDDAFPNASQDETITGTAYQEVLTNFPFGSQVLTGLFLTVTLTAPGAAAQSYDRALVDRIGFAARQGLTGTSVSVNPNGPPPITALDLTTINILPGRQGPRVLALSAAEAAALEAEVNGLASASGNVSVTADSTAVMRAALTASNRLRIAHFLAMSETYTYPAADALRLRAYLDSPRITIVRTIADSSTGTLMLTQAIDLRKNDMRALAGPNETTAAPISFEILRGIADSFFESQVMDLPQPQSGPSSPTPVSADLIFRMANAQGVPIVVLSPGDEHLVDTLAISPDAKARIAQALASGCVIVVPSQAVTIAGAPRFGWYEANPATGAVLGVMDDGGHQAIIEYAKAIGIGFVIGVSVSIAAESIVFFLHKAHAPPPIIWAGVAAPAGAELIHFWSNPANYRYSFAGVFVGFAAGLFLGLTVVSPFYQAILHHIFPDPPLPPARLDAAITTFPGSNNASADVATTASVAAGAVQGGSQLASTTVSGQMSASWNAAVSNGFRIQSLSTTGASVTNGNGAAVGSGAVSLALAVPVAADVRGNNQYSVNGTGSLSFYGPAESSLGVSGNWAHYAANVTGNIAITITTDGLMLNGTLLPAGTYTITTSAATLSGSGPTSSPNFAGTATVTSTNGTVNLGPGTGTVTVGGNALDTSHGATLTGYTGTVTAAAVGSGLDKVTLSGTTANVLTVSTSPASITADQNTPASFQVNVNTSFADTYNLTVQAPPGWAVTIDNTGKVTATPAPGFQSGTYPIQIVAQSTTNSDLVAQTTVNVTITPTVPGAHFTVTPDSQFTVPFNGAQLPTAFRASLQNLGPSADTYSLSFTNVPTGFTLLNSGTSVTVPAGQTGILGLYLQPSPGQPIPPPGTQLSFTVTATSTTNPAITQSQVVTFTVPVIDAVNLTSTPTTLNTTPGVPLTATLTVTDVGNVPETVSLADALPTGLTASSLSPVNLAVGQSTTEILTLTPGSSTPLNSLLQATVTATFGPSASPVTQTLTLPVKVVVPGAAAIANASLAAQQLGNGNLASRLNDLSIALTNLVQSPTSAVYSSQAQASLGAVVALLAGDPHLASVVPTLTRDGAALSQATTASAVQAAVATLGNDLTPVGNTLSDEAAHGFTLVLSPNTVTVLLGAPADIPLNLQNTGSQVTTYDLSVSGLPANVTAKFMQNGKAVTSVTVQPGQDLFGGNTGVTLELTETGGSLFPTGFTVMATAEGAPEITQSAQGTLTVAANLVAVTEVDATPAFIQPGSGLVDVTAKVLNSVNRQQQALVSYTLSDPSGKTVFTSTPVSLTLTVQTSLATVDLRTFATTSLATGSYTINVTVTDASGSPIPGGTGQGNVLIGTPVISTLTVSPTTLPAGNGTVTNTLTVNGQASFSNPLTLKGQVQTTPTSTTVALDAVDNIAYVAGTNGIDIVDISNPASPKLLSTFGQSEIVQGGLTVVRADTIGGTNYLVVGTTTQTNANQFTLLIYSLANGPTSPQLVSSTPFNYEFLQDMLVQGNTVLVPTQGGFITSSGDVFDRFGTLLSIDISNPTAPTLAEVLFNKNGAPTGGDNPESGGTIVNSQLAYIGSTSLAGGNTTGTGQLLVVDYSNPAQLSVVNQLTIPGTTVIDDIAIQGNRALVVGSTDIGTNINIPPPGNLTLTVLDITDPLHPQVLGGTLVTNGTFPAPAGAVNKLSALPLGNGQFAVSEAIVNGNPVLLLVDPSNPNNIVVTTDQVPALVNEMAVSGNLLYTTSSAGLAIYQIGTLQSIPFTASVEIPNNTGVAVVPGSFSIPPTQTITGTNFDTLIWTESLAFGESQPTFTWQSTVSNLQPGEARDVTLGGGVAFTSQGTPGTVNLPPTIVSGAQVLALSPASQTVAPATTAAYTVTAFNPTTSSITYNLKVLGVPAGWVNLPGTVTVAPQSSSTVTLQLTSDSFAALSDYGLTVTATDPVSGAVGSVSGDLILAGQPPLIDPSSHGVVVQLTPTQASAGQGTSATYVVQLTNTGSATETYTLSDMLPPGVAGSFSQPTITVPPGLSNFRDVMLALTPAVGTAPGSDPFSVTANSTTSVSVNATANGTLNVLGNGVSVSLNPPSGAPGTSFQMTVTNTGQTTDTFDLALASPAGLVAKLATSKITLAPGASQVVPITTGAVNFAVAGPLALTGMATSETNAAVKAGDSATLTIPTTLGLAASFSPGSQTVSIPGTGTFLLQVNNTGNTEDAYTATIMATSGPITAHLMGLDGQPTQTIPLFRLPGLSSGAILLQATQMGPGQGTVTVQVQSLNHANLMAAPIALQTAAALPITPVPAPPPASLLSNFWVLGLEISGFSAVGLVTVPALQVLDLTFGYFPGFTQSFGLVATPAANGMLEELFFNGMGTEFFALLQLLQSQSALRFNWLGLSPSFDLQVTVAMPQAGAITAGLSDGQGAAFFSTPFFPLPPGR